jgi:hypothetical protein
MWVRVAVALCAVVVLPACQPAGGPGAQSTPEQGSAGEPAIGAPQAGPPGSLSDLVTRADLVAEEWQDEPVLVEVEVSVDADGRWTSARAVYLAADADRFLALDSSGDGFSQQRPTLETLQLQPVSSDGLAAVPPFPADAAEPTDLAQSGAAGECGVGPPATVLYATGAPVAWDGAVWTSPPDWRATVSSDDAVASLDLADGSLTRCLE